MSELNNIRTWAQGYFVDQPQYKRWSDEQKAEANYQESFNVRPSPTGNAICRCMSTEDSKWIAKRLNKCVDLEAENQQLREALEQIDNMAISPEWRNEPLWRIVELTEAALQEDTYHSKDWKDQMIQDQGLEE